VWPFSSATCCCEATSQILTVLSLEPVKKRGGDGQQLQNMNRNTVWIKFQDIFASKYFSCFTSICMSHIATISSQARAVLYEQCNHKHIQMR
jgi:hypothetical protein